jgi:hypothetical protein
MRHRAPRPFTNLLHRVPRATARLIGQAARPGPGRALVALLAVLSLGTAAYAAVGSVTGGSSNPQAESASATASRDSELQSESRDGGRSSLTSGLPTPDGPASSLGTPSSTSEAAQPSITPEARQSPKRRASATSSTKPKDNNPPTTSLSAAFPASDAATFTFSADEPASFTCSLDGAAYASCDSPTSYSDLSPGWHTFAVRATDSAGNVDASPAETRFHAEVGRSTDQ